LAAGAAGRADAAPAKLEYGAAYLALTGFLAVMAYEPRRMLGATPHARGQTRNIKITDGSRPGRRISLAR